jgi:AraC family transcriptional regulator
LEAGDTIFRPAHYAHSHALKTNGYHCFNIEFKKNWQQGLNYHFELPDDRVIYKAGSSPGIYKLFCYFINNIPQDFLEETLLDWVFESNPRSAKFRSLPWLEKVVAILERESDIHHTIHSISGRVFVHPIYLSGAFKKRTGYTISEYQLKIKAEKAFSLLLSTNLPVAEVALKAGFYDSPHLINSFKLAYGSSPGKLRAKVKKLI